MYQSNVKFRLQTFKHVVDVNKTELLEYVKM